MAITTHHAFCVQSPLWTSGAGECHTYRIPALAALPDGAVLAFCEGRRHSAHDHGQIDLMLRRSDDGGSTWEPSCPLVQQDGMTCGNPCPIVDAQRGNVWLLLCKNPAQDRQGLVMRGLGQRTVWALHSGDSGRTWSAPRQITDQVKHPRWTWYATGPGHGLQLASGRLVAPANHCNPWHYQKDLDRYTAHAILSDDGGRSWRVGGSIDENTNEGMLVELSDGSLFFHGRYEGRDDFRRVVSFSCDGGESFAPARRDSALFDPTCQASSLRATTPDARAADLVLFANPASLVPMGRSHLTVRASLDRCATWPIARTLHFGRSAYSDLAQNRGGELLCLYEHGEHENYQHLMLARFNLDWLMNP
jgi:sialidase-1